ncbi:MAG: DNA gyrase subunit A [Holosporales bacterium]
MSLSTEAPQQPNQSPQDIIPVTIEDEMRRSYLDYAMSVIVSRALPDVRDGLKPVHRRILYAMKESGFEYNRPHRKSAHVTGGVMAKYHPHGNIPIYDAMVRMAQDFSMRIPLIDGQGNFGSMDGDPAAAERYTESRLSKPAHTLLDDIDRDTVDYKSNYDDSTVEPVVLPARFPNLLVNGAGGIAVGMATNIPPHNLGEVIDACCAYIDNPEVTTEDLMAYVPGPDFPTGGVILGRAGIYDAYRTGRGSIVMRGRASIEEIRKDRNAIVITEIPYQVNKARMLERFAEVVRDKIIEGISDLRDESDRQGVRVVVELKRDAVPDVVLNQLYRYTPLQTSFGVNALALDKGQPKVMTLRDMIAAFVQFREEVVTRGVRYELNKARERAHVVVGLVMAVANIDEMITLIKNAPDPNVAREQMMAREWPAHDVAPLIELVAEPGYAVVNGKYRLSETQARAILDLRLHRLTGLEREKLAAELSDLADKIRDYLDILASRPRILKMMRDDLMAIRNEFADDRRTTIEEADGSVDMEDLIQCEDMVITVSQNGYIKRVPLASYRAQRRGGKGRTGMSTRDEDFVREVYVADTHTPVLFFSTRGIAYMMKVYRLPIGTPTSLGKAMINLLPLQQGETIATILPLPKDQSTCEQMSIVFATSKGDIRRNALSDFLNVKSNGKIAMKLGDDESLVGVQVITEDQDVLLSTRMGKCIRFSLEELRVFAGRTSTGVRGIRLAPDDEVISLAVLNHTDFTMEDRDAYLRWARKNRGAEEDENVASDESLATSEQVSLSPERLAAMAAAEQFILTVTNKGYGKRTSAYEYRITGRGGQGVANMELTAKNGQIVASFIVNEFDQVVLVTDGGQLIRCPIHDVRIAGRKTQGVTLFRVGDGESVVSVARIELSEEDLKAEADAETVDDEGANVQESQESSAVLPAAGESGA